MAEIRFKISKDLPVEIIKFELENNLNLIISRIKRIKEEIKTLQLSEEDLKIFEKAREEAWKETKQKHRL